MTPEQIAAKVALLQALILELRVEANTHKPLVGPCPLAGDHYDLSHIVDGQGTYEWSCPFCGEFFSE